MKSIPKVLAGCLLVFLALTGSPALADSTVVPTQMHGVKFKHPGGDQTGPDQSIAKSCDYQKGTAGRSYRSVFENLHGNGIYHLFIKFPQPNQVPKTCTESKLTNEIIVALRAMTNLNQDLEAGEQPMRAWVWERDWFWDDSPDDNDPTPPTDDNCHPDPDKDKGYCDFVRDMARVIERAQDAGVSEPLEGIAPIETNLPGSERVREFALQLAKDINARTNGWLRTHTLLFPGGGMGSWFRNIGGSEPDFAEGTQFLNSIAAEVKYFSFIYKWMQSHDGNVCKNLEPYYHGTSRAENPEDGTYLWKEEIHHTRTFDEQRSYIEGVLGFGDLAAFIRDVRARDAAYADVANVVFWGDSGDGLLQMNRTNVQLMHSLLVDQDGLGQPGHFFDFAIIGADESTGKERSKHVLLDRGSEVIQNHNEARRERGADGMTVWEEWHSWRNPDAAY